MSATTDLANVVMTYAAAIRSALKSGTDGWEKRLDKSGVDKLLQAKAEKALAAAERPAAKKAKADLRRKVRKAEDDTVTSPTGGDGIFFDEANPYSVSWAKTRSSELVTSISDSMREAVRVYVADAVEAGVPPKNLGKQLEGVVGLRPDQAESLAAQRAALEEAGRNPDEIDRLIQARGGRLLEQRAMLIARTELTAAQNAGALAEWAQSAADGDIPPDSMREWLDADGCPICVELVEAGAVPLNKPWHSDILGKDVWMPPAHPACRCTTALVIP